MKFSIITPAYNLDKYISTTIESVLSQAGDFEIEYIVVDGGSTDRTFEIAKEYTAKISSGAFPISCTRITMKCIVETAKGMYSAIDRGFAEATGDIFAWINADDFYSPDAFKNISKSFKEFPEIEWIKGNTSTVNENGQIIRKPACRIYDQTWIAKGIYGQQAYFIEQDSVFWKADLWKKAGPIPAHLHYAGDYWLWKKFATLVPLWSLDMPVSSFRKRKGQLSGNVASYKSEQRSIQGSIGSEKFRARLFFSPQSRISALFPQNIVVKKFFSSVYATVFRNEHSYLAIENGRVVKKSTRAFIVSR